MKLKLFLNRPCNLFEYKRQFVAYLLGMACFAFLFLSVFEPFDIGDSDHNKYLEISMYVGSGLVIALLYFFLIKFLFKSYTVISTIALTFLCVFIMGIVDAIFGIYYFKNVVYTFDIFFLYFIRVVFVLIFPAIIFLLVHSNISYKRRMLRLLAIEEMQHPKEEDEQTLIYINSDNKKEKQLILSLRDLFYIESQNNYVEVIFFNGEAIINKLFRYSLYRIMKDNKEVPELFRCHKSFVVNRKKISFYSGNATGYKLKLIDIEKSIPVSRKLNEEIKMIAKKE